MIAALAPRWLRIGGYWYPRGGIPMTSSIRPRSRLPGCGSPIRAWRPIAVAAEGGPDPRGDPRPGIGRRLRRGRLCRGCLADEVRDGLREFIARGYHGDMGWLAGTAERRGDPRALWSEARTVIVLGFNYTPEDDPLALAEIARPAPCPSMPAGAIITTP